MMQTVTVEEAGKREKRKKQVSPASATEPQSRRPYADTTATTATTPPPDPKTWTCDLPRGLAGPGVGVRWRWGRNKGGERL